MTGIKKIITGFLTLTVSGLMLTSCNTDMTKGLREHYTKEEASDELKTGAEKMEDRIMVDEAHKPGAETDDKLKKGALGFWLTNIETHGYLPASLVLSDGEVRDFVRDRDRKDLIVVGMNVYVPEETDLSIYTVDNIESIEKEYGLYFERLILNTDKEQLDFNQNGDERNVSISKNEK